MSEKYFVLLGFSFQVAISEMKITEFDKRLNFSYFINESFYVNSTSFIIKYMYQK